jgi:hypothetical protein
VAANRTLIAPPSDSPKSAARSEPARVHHGAYVVHSVFEWRRRGNRVGKPRAPLVEQDQPRERGKPVEEAGDPRVSPLQVQVRDEARHEDEVERPIADDLVRDVDLTALRVVGVWGHDRTHDTQMIPLRIVNRL